MWKKQDMKVAKTDLLNLLGQIASGTHSTVMQQEVGKELTRVSRLRIIQGRNKIQSQPFWMKQQYFVQIEWWKKFNWATSYDIGVYNIQAHANFVWVTSFDTGVTIFP